MFFLGYFKKVWLMLMIRIQMYLMSDENVYKANRIINDYLAETSARFKRQGVEKSTYMADYLLTGCDSGPDFTNQNLRWLTTSAEAQYALLAEISKYHGVELGFPAASENDFRQHVGELSDYVYNNFESLKSRGGLFDRYQSVLRDLDKAYQLLSDEHNRVTA